MPKYPTYYPWTLWDYTNEEVENLKKNADKFSYLCWAPEFSEEGKPHLQGFVMSPGQSQWGWQRCQTQGKFPKRTHFEIPNGSPSRGIGYCQGPYVSPDKTKTKPFNPDFVEFGQRPEDPPEKKSHGGRRPGAGRSLGQTHVCIEALVPLIKGGMPIEELMEKHINVYMRYGTKLNALYEAFAPNQLRQGVRVLILWGGSGVMKTNIAKAYLSKMGYSRSEIYPKSASLGEYWQGLKSRHRACIMNEIIDPLKGPSMSLTSLNQLFDFEEDSLQVNCKGGSRWCLFDMIIVTSNTDPRHWFMRSYRDAKGVLVKEPVEEEYIGSLLRRAKIIHMTRTEAADEIYKAEILNAKDEQIKVHMVPGKHGVLGKIPENFSEQDELDNKAGIVWTPNKPFAGETVLPPALGRIGWKRLVTPEPSNSEEMKTLELKLSGGTADCKNTSVKSEDPDDENMESYGSDDVYEGPQEPQEQALGELKSFIEDYTPFSWEQFKEQLDYESDY